MSSNRLNYIVIIDSIPVGESNTAFRLYEDIETAVVAYEHVPPVNYVRIESNEEFLDVLSQLCNKTINSNQYPLLHIECHGAMQGIQLANGSCLTWEQVREGLTPLNVATRLNIMVVFSACYGGAFASSMRLSDRAPLWGLIGPTREVYPDELEADFGRFYRALYSTSSPSKAIATLNEGIKENLYWRKTSEAFFLDVWARYKETYCTETVLAQRGHNMKEKAVARGLFPIKTEEEYAQILIDKEPVLFDKYRDIYFMYDLFEENRNRFPITYEQAELHCS